MATTAETGQIPAGFEAVLVVTVLARERALETSKILLLKSVEERKDESIFSLPFFFSN